MSRAIAESDWKKFRQVRLVALDRFCRRVLADCQEVCSDESMTAHERYGKLYGLIHDRDKDMARAFDDPRRSTADLQLRLMVYHGLVLDEELSQFSPDVQRVVKLQ